MELPIEQEPLTLHATSVLRDSPRVTLTAAAISIELTQALIRLAEPRLGVGLVSGDEGGKLIGGRSCETAWFKHHEHPVVRAVVDAMAAIAGLECGLAEQLHVVRYSNGGQYKPHFDSYDLNTENGRRFTARRGQRKRTALLYLNEDFVGGATRFSRLGLEVRPSLGSVLTFENCLTGTAVRDDRSLHAGAPVEKGEKWLGTLWFRER